MREAGKEQATALNISLQRLDEVWRLWTSRSRPAYNWGPLYPDLQISDTPVAVRHLIRVLSYLESLRSDYISRTFVRLFWVTDCGKALDWL